MKQKSLGASEISGFHRELSEKCAIFFLFGGEDSWKVEKETDRLFRNVGKKLSLALRNNPEERSSHLSLGV